MMLANNAKHNQHGRVDEHGVMRHRQVELCPVGAMALLFFTHFHRNSVPAPDFEPQFDQPEYSEYGHQAWYNNYLF